MAIFKEPGAHPTCYGMMMHILRGFALGTGLLMAAAVPALAQALPPTSQQLQQQHDQTIQNESNAAHSNLTQLQLQQTQQATPHITSSGRAVANPPGYIPMPRH